MTHQLLDAVHTRACTGIKEAHNSVTVQNRTHVYMNFFDHKNLGNLLQLRPKVVKHPVYIYNKTGIINGRTLVFGAWCFRLTEHFNSVGILVASLFKVSWYMSLHQYLLQSPLHSSLYSFLHLPVTYFLLCPNVELSALFYKILSYVDRPSFTLMQNGQHYIPWAISGFRREAD